MICRRTSSLAPAFFQTSVRVTLSGLQLSGEAFLKE
jgi:hypothetical protein